MDNGKTKCHIIKENKKIIKEYIKVNIIKDKNMEKENLSGMIILHIKDNFKKEFSMESVYSKTLIKITNIMDDSLITKSMEKPLKLIKN